LPCQEKNALHSYWQNIFFYSGNIFPSLTLDIAIKLSFPLPFLLLLILLFFRLANFIFTPSVTKQKHQNQNQHQLYSKYFALNTKSPGCYAIRTILQAFRKHLNSSQHRFLVHCYNRIITSAAMKCGLVLICWKDRLHKFYSSEQ
jgi:hypothetical protein